MMPFNPNRLFGMPLPNTFVNRLPHGIDAADPGMVAPPVADPGYAMPNADMSNLNQSLGYPVQGTLPAGYQQPQQGWTFDPAQAQAALDAMKRT